jgi:excisionase family DNA binding protein
VPEPIYLKTRECAVLLGVTTRYIVGEIRDGRLPARYRVMPSGRIRYRVSVEDWRAYVQQHWPMKKAG